MKNMSNALQIPNNIHDFDMNSISEFLNKISNSKIILKNINDYPNNLQGFSLAHYESIFDDKLETIKSSTIYTTIPTNKDEEKAIIAAITHEYTHILQRENDKVYFGIKNFINNVDEVKIIEHFTSLGFLELEQIIISQLVTIKEFQVMLNRKIESKSEFHNEEIVNIITKNFNKIIIEKIIDTILKKIKNFSNDFNENYKQAVKSYFKTMYNMEYEAKTIQKESLKILHSQYEYIFNETISAGIYKALIELNNHT